MQLTNEFLSIEFSETTGAIVQIRDLQNNLDLMDEELKERLSGKSAFDLSFEGYPPFADFKFTSKISKKADLQMGEFCWDSSIGIQVRGEVTLPAGERCAILKLQVINESDHIIKKITYPKVQGITELSSEPDKNCLAHPQATGFLFRDPMNLFKHRPGAFPAPQPMAGLNASIYPKGFDGSSMQFMTYYVEDIGGFYFACYDSEGHKKWLNFFKSSDDRHLEAAFTHEADLIEQGTAPELSYNMVIGTLEEGSWYAAADRYRRWALAQPWCGKGPLVQRKDIAKWLLEDVQYVTFGVNPVEDRSPWFQLFHDAVDGPVFHILGVNWPRQGQDYRNSLRSMEKEEWFPAKFHRKNLETIKGNGDYMAAFEFDLLTDPRHASFAKVQADVVDKGAAFDCWDTHHFVYLCPTTESLRDFHKWRGLQLAECGMDAFYYDISANNMNMSCYSKIHPHEPGSGGVFVKAYGELWEQTKAAASSMQQQYIPQGTEMISEVFLDKLDYYQARAEAGPVSTFEGDYFRDWVIAGKADKIPMFAYVYHDYAPVRMDGWSKLSKEFGDIYYWIASRVTLWGGLFELNYEFSLLEELNGEQEDAERHYAPIDDLTFAIDSAKLDFLKEVGSARTQFGTDYLSYGRMLRPLTLNVPTTELDWYFYNGASELASLHERGKYKVPAVTHAAWQDSANNVGLFFVNLSLEEITLEVSVGEIASRLPGNARYSLQQSTRSGSKELKPADGQNLAICLPPRKIVLVEAKITHE